MERIEYFLFLVFAAAITWPYHPLKHAISDGLTIEQPNGIAINIPLAGTNAVQVAQAGVDGIQIQSAGRDGVRVSNAVGYGINANGTMGAGYFNGKVEVTSDLNASKIGINSPIATNTRLNVKGNSFFGGNMLLTSISAVPAAGNNILEVEFDSFTDPVADAWTTYSSRRWKTNIRTMDQAMDRIKRLRGVTFDWKKSGKQDFGLIAEEVAEVLPEIVAFEKNGVDAKSVDYARIVALLIEAIKEQQLMIDEITTHFK